MNLIIFKMVDKDTGRAAILNIKLFPISVTYLRLLSTEVRIRTREQQIISKIHAVVVYYIIIVVSYSFIF
jgi:hypothetical protein